MNRKRTILIGFVVLVVLGILALLLLGSQFHLMSGTFPMSGTFRTPSFKPGTAAAPPGPDVIIVDEAPDTCPGYGSLELAQRYYEDFDHAWDKDWFLFTATANVLYTIRLSDLENKADTVLYLYAAGCTDLNPIQNDNCVEDNPGSGSCVTWQAPTSGTYHIYVRNRAWQTDYGPGTGYTLTIQENQ